MLNTRALLVSVIAALASAPSLAAPDYVNDDPIDLDERMGWWRESRFGMFIHWGLYAIPAGEWNGERIPGISEWIMRRAEIPAAEYDELIPQFNPVKFDAEEWAEIAADAGMQYVVITTKHHDGFCLYDSPHTDRDIMSTPYKRDIMAELAPAVRDAGLKMGWYHSILDWGHPAYEPRLKWDPRPGVPANMNGEYVPFLFDSIEHLLTEYGDIGIVWFDGEWEGTWTHELGKRLYQHCRELQPNVIVNNRVDKGRRGMQHGGTVEGFAGDFGTPEQHIPATGLPGVDWEVCMTMNGSWGYKWFDEDWKSTESLIHKLCDIASKGGNFLLNIGPKADGTIPQPSIDRLREIGDWMNVNGEAIYGTTASPFGLFDWGRCTAKIDENGSTLYLHIFDWPEDGRLDLDQLGSRVIRASLLADENREIGVHPSQRGLYFDVGSAAPDQICSVLKLEIEGEPIVLEDRMAWWREARFGMFVHWGLYSGLAGTWQGEPVTSRKNMEWIQQAVGADTWEYTHEAAPHFRPKPGFAEQWAELAKEAGCKYMVFTTKHHDGFALHDSAVTNFDAMDLIGRDLTKEIVDAFRDEGLKIGMYHSVIDWHHPQYDYQAGGWLPHPLRDRPSFNGERDHGIYVDYLHDQVRELMTGYGDIDIVWWDYSSKDGQGPFWRADDLMAMVRGYHPDILTNNRLYAIVGPAKSNSPEFLKTLRDIDADFMTPEQHIPDTGVEGIDWEVCQTMNETWGFSTHDLNWKSDETLIRQIVDTVSKGGNYLLNIGPKGDGTVPQESIDSLRAIGRWMGVNGESIYGTTASPFPKPDWGRYTAKIRGDVSTLYIHIFDWPENGEIFVKQLGNRVTSATLLADPDRKIDVQRRDGGNRFSVGSAAPDPICSVLKVEMGGAPGPRGH